MSRLPPLHAAALALCAMACGADGAGRRVGAQNPFDDGTSPTPSAAGAEEACGSGPASCFCPDGSETGTQLCDARGELGPCSCPPTSSASSTGRAGARPVMGDPARVCDAARSATIAAPRIWPRRGRGYCSRTC